MAHAGLGLDIQQRFMHPVAADRLKRQRGDEFLCPAGHGDAHLAAALAQAAHQLGRLVGRDSRRYADQYVPGPVVAFG